MMVLYNTVLIFSMLAVVVSLVWGVASMAHGGHYDEDHAEPLMIARVGFQALAIILILLAMLFPY